MVRYRSPQAETEDVNPRRLQRGAVKRTHLTRWSVGHDELAPGVVGDTHLHPTALEVIREIAAGGPGIGATVTLSTALQAISSGGEAVEWTTVVAGPVSIGFEGLVLPTASLPIPTRAYWRLHLRFDWDTWRLGGTVTVKVDGVTVDSVVGTFGSRFSTVTALGVCEVGQIVRVEVDHDDASAHDMTNARCTLELVELPVSAAEVMLDEFFMDSRVHSMHASHLTYAESAIVLAAGMTYRVTVEGTFTYQTNNPLPNGESGVPIMFLSPGQVQRDSGRDAEVIFAEVPAASYPYHAGAINLEMNTGSGWSHIEPEGGPYPEYEPGHLYTYMVDGEGATLRAATMDDPLTDNNGMLRVRIWSITTGGGI